MKIDQTEQDSLSAPGVISPKNETKRLRLSFLAPLLVAIASIVAVMVFVNYSYHQRQLQSGSVQLRTTAAKLYEDSVQQNIRALHMVMDVLERDTSMHHALARKDRQALLVQAAPLFVDLKRNYGITHFYFVDTNRMNLLRVHQPARYGDVIERVTMLNAERSGAISYGIELGPLGLLTLRVVSPWYDMDTQKLIGYVELGMEIDHILANVQNLFGVEVFALIKKQYLQRKGWEDGMLMMGRRPDWEQFHDVVLSVQGQHEIPDSLVKIFRDADVDHSAHTIELSCNGHPCQAMPLALSDVSGRAVAEVVMLADTSSQVSDAQQAVMLGSITSIVSGVALFVFFYWLVGRIGRRIERDELMLHNLASRDGLTGLYNHRMFYIMLEEEISRSRRYQRQVSMLLIDIDHFKRVNDTYGHVAGDRVLEGISRVLETGVRHEDKLCRYGGEEIAVILPESSVQAAVYSAERLRTSVEEASFRDDEGQEIKITVSIGVATLPAQVPSLQELVNASDAALYVAKESGRNRVCLFENTAST
ncbi:MAG: diguanylate cyclase [Gallionella sp.]|nr:diguanylate cyclase [Gallionella sp.]